MQVSVEKISPVLIQLQVEIDAARVTSEYDKAFQTVSRAAKIKGFRPGKAPKDIVRRVFGARVEADVIQKLVDETFPRAAADQKLMPVAQPSVEPDRLASGKPFVYRAKVEILPAIESVTYEGLVAQRPSATVGEEEIQTELEAIRRANSTIETPKSARPIQKNDIVSVDLKVSVNGTEIPDAAATGYSIEVGSAQVFAPIEAAIEGAKVGDTVSAEVEIGKGHPHPKLAGEKAVFSIEIKEHKERVLPALDDDLAKDLGNFETLEALKEDVKKQLEARKKDSAENVLAERLVKALVDANPIPVPPSLVAQQMRLSEREILMRAQMQGTRATGLGDALKAQVLEDSEMKVRAGLIMAEIAKKEAIQIGNEQIEEGLKELAEQTGKNVAKLRAEYSDPKKREMLIGMILENKVLDLIEAKAQITEE